KPQTNKAHLPAAYPRHYTTNTLKGYKVLVRTDKEGYVASAVASLSIPASLGEGFEVVLEDTFLEVCAEDVFDALEELWEEVERMGGRGSVGGGGGL
ncbi:hypothetical protein GQ44DRAFT_611408, partial [Phaeosphaeriaceae sp. PMI808]